MPSQLKTHRVGSGGVANKRKATGALPLSEDSEYEQRFGTRHRGRGRPSGVGPLMDGVGVDPLLVRIAKNRAFAVVHDEQTDRLRALFTAELAVLRKRGVSRVAKDVGVELEEGAVSAILDPARAKARAKARVGADAGARVSAGSKS